MKKGAQSRGQVQIGASHLLCVSNLDYEDIRLSILHTRNVNHGEGSFS